MTKYMYRYGQPLMRLTFRMLTSEHKHEDRLDLVQLPTLYKGLMNLIEIKF